VKLERLALDISQSVAYVFDFGDEWRVRLKLVEVRTADGAPPPGVFDQRGVVPPQYGWGEDDFDEVA
jgi:hypothetical protein